MKKLILFVSIPVLYLALVGAIVVKAQNAAPKVGGALPDFEYTTLSGDKSTVKAVYSANKITLVDFWASWCGPCRRTMEALKPVYEEYHPLGLEIISFSIDDVDKDWRTVSEQLMVKWINCSSDEKGRKDVTTRYGIRVIPTLYVVDSEGRILSTTHSVDELKALFSEKLK